MKVEGVVRHIDALGRVVVPREFRKSLNINEGDPLEIVLTKQGILLKIENTSNKLKSFTDEELIKELKSRNVEVR